ncbi:hypothetical protein ACFSZS_11715 [Seohaeicola zhoushanensis]
MSATDVETYEPLPDTGGPAQPLLMVRNLRKYFPCAAASSGARRPWCRR